MGGLGIRPSATMIQANQALLTKLGWQLAIHVDKLWFKVLKAQYYPNATLFFNSTCKSSSSWCWKGIFGTKV